MQAISKIRFVFLLVLPMFFFSCGSDRTEAFSVRTDVDYSIQGGLNAIVTHFFIQNNVPTFWETFINNSGLSEDQIGDVLPSRASINSRFGENLDFINTVSIWVYDTQYEQGTEIFYMEPVEIGDKTEIKLFSNITEVGNWIKEDQVLIEVRLTLRQIVAATTDIRVNLEFAAFTIE